MESKFKPGVRVKAKPNAEDEGKTGTIVEKGIWINHTGKPVDPPRAIWFVLWDGETDKKLKNEDELEIV